MSDCFIYSSSRSAIYEVDHVFKKKFESDRAAFKPMSVYTESPYTCSLGPITFLRRERNEKVTVIVLNEFEHKDTK